MTFHFIVRIETKAGKPSAQFEVGDPTEATYDDLAGKVIAFAFPQEDPGLFNISLKCEIQPGWWMPISNSKELLNTIHCSQDRVFALVSATVEYKVASLAVLKPPAVVCLSSMKAAPKPTAVKRKNTTTKLSLPRGDKKKKPVLQMILSALAELEAIGISPAPRVQVALFSGYSNVKSAGFAKSMSTLKSNGHIEYPDKKSCRLTPAGSAVAGSVAAPPTSNEAVHERIKKLLKPKTCEIFDQLASGAAVNRMVVANATGYTNEKSAGFAKSLSTMSSLGILEYPKDEANPKNKLVQLTDIAFPFSRPDSTAAVGQNVATDDDTVTDDGQPAPAKYYFEMQA